MPASGEAIESGFAHSCGFEGIMKKRVKGIELRQQNPDRSLFGINRMANEIPPDAQTIPAHVSLIRRQCQDQA